MTIPPELIQRLLSAKNVAVLTGAGVSVESGVPTFRDAQTGLWANFRPEDLATPPAFRKNPKLVWEWYAWRRTLVAGAKPNPAHNALAEMQSLFPQFALITQNVDGLHQLAGSRNVIELHGNISKTKCFNEGHVRDRMERNRRRSAEMPQLRRTTASGSGLVRRSVARNGNSKSARGGG
jgi:NAD-dependent deacetylase